MKTMGLIGGLSWTSTAVYYRLINELVQQRLGGRHSARLILWSVDFAEHLAIHDSEGWEGATEEIIGIGCRLRDAGADFLVLCVNTVHRVADEVEEAVGLPFVHIADAAGSAIAASGIKKVGLLGTRYVMGEDFYRQRLAERYGVEVIVPEGDDFQTIDRIIFDELVIDKYEESSRQICLQISERLIAAGAEGIVLACTELPQLFGQTALPVPVFDTLQLHAEAAVNAALA